MDVISTRSNDYKEYSDIHRKIARTLWSPMKLLYFQVIAINLFSPPSLIIPWTQQYQVLNLYVYKYY